MTSRVLLLNAASGGATGNSAVLLRGCRSLLRRVDGLEIDEVTLAEREDPRSVITELRQCQALMVATGTYWDQWSWHLQRTLEVITDTEGTDLWLGKPAACLVTMHSVGGKAVLSRLQGVLNTFGALIPPMTGLVYSAVAQAALKTDDRVSDDLWQPADLEVVCHNLVTAILRRCDWRSWPVDRRSFDQRWICTEPETKA